MTSYHSVVTVRVWRAASIVGSLAFIYVVAHLRDAKSSVYGLCPCSTALKLSD